MPRSPLGSLTLAWLAVHAVPALAICDDTTPATGITVTCTGASPGGITADVGSTDVVINIEAGATVGGTFGAVIHDESTINNAGTVNASGGSVGFVARGDDNRITNLSSGVVSTTGTNSVAIAVNGNSNYILNQGLITTSNGGAYGISAIASPGITQTGNELINTGTIRTSGPTSHAIFARQNDRARLENRGTVETSGNNATGLRAVGGSSRLLNTGTVRTSGPDANAVYMQGNDNRLTNRGRLETSGSGDAEAVFSNTVGSSFTALIENESGAVIRSEQSVAIRGLNGQETLINSGTIFGGGGTAVSLGGGNDTVILRTGSQVTGRIDGGTGNNLLELEGRGSLTSDVDNFERLEMSGAAWAWNGTGQFNTANLNSGVFTLNGLVGGTVSVANGATLTGRGQVAGDLAVAGAVRPGNGTGNGVLTVDGDFVQQPGSTLEVTQRPGSADRLLVLGRATIQGGMVLVREQVAGSYTIGSRVPVLTANGGVTGSYLGLQLPKTLFIRSELSYDANNVYLTTLQVTPFADLAEGDNRMAVADTLDAVQVEATGTLSEVINEVAKSTEAKDVDRALDALAGSAYPTEALLFWQAQSALGRSLADRMSELRSSAAATSSQQEACTSLPNIKDQSCESHWWLRVRGEKGRLSGAEGVADADSQVRSITLGTDRRIQGGAHAGLVLDLSTATSDLGNTTARSDADGYTVGLFGGKSLEQFHWAAHLTLGTWRSDVSRQVTVGDFNRTGRGKLRATTMGAEIEVGRLFESSAWQIEPFATFRLAQLRVRNVAETGLGEVGLLVDSPVLNSQQLALGARVSARLAETAWSWHGQLRVGREFGDTAAQSQVAFSGAPGQTFNIMGAGAGRNVIAYKVALHRTADASPWQLLLAYEGETSRNWRSSTLSAQLTHRW